jgi:hypothetical protein
MKRLVLLLPLITATACTSETGNDQSANDDNAAFSISFGSGNISFSNMSVQGPSLRSDPARFSLNGVHLYPGSEIIDQRIEIDRAGVRTMSLSFKSTAAAATVLRWFRTQLEKAGYSLSMRGDILIGQDPHGHPFSLIVSDQDPGTKGVIKEHL